MYESNEAIGMNRVNVFDAPMFSRCFLLPSLASAEAKLRKCKTPSWSRSRTLGFRDKFCFGRLSMIFDDAGLVRKLS